MPAGSYPSQTAGDRLGRLLEFYPDARDLPDDVAYRLARALHGIEAELCKKLPQACETTAMNTLAAAPKPELIHPGVLKYLREIGVAK